MFLLLCERLSQVGTTDVQRKTKAILSKNVPKPQFTKKSKESKERKAGMENSSPILKVLDNHGNRKVSPTVLPLISHPPARSPKQSTSSRGRRLTRSTWRSVKLLNTMAANLNPSMSGDKVAIIEEFDDGWCQVCILSLTAPISLPLHSFPLPQFASLFLPSLPSSLSFPPHRSNCSVRVPRERRSSMP